MMAEDFLRFCADLTMIVLALSLILVCIRIIKGPTLPDRIIALDLLVGIAVGFIAAFGIRTDAYQFLDIAIALGLIGFLATVAFARFVLSRGQAGDAANTLGDTDAASSLRGNSP